MPKKFSINFDDMIKKIKDQEKTFKKEVDETLFVPKYKEDGTHVSVIRFLPSPDTDVPFIKKFNHGFQEKGGWLIEECPTSIGQKCPVCEDTNNLWNQGMEEAYRLRKKRVNYYANILIVKDPQTPENEGKVFKYRFGKKIYDKIMEKISPTDGISDPVMVFDWYEGANFKLVIKQIKVANKKPQPNYDSSVFAEATSVGNDAKIEELIEVSHKLAPLTDPSLYKTYAELADKLDKVTKTTGRQEMRGSKISPEKADTATESEDVLTGEESTTPLALAEETDEDFFTNLKKGKK